MILDTSVVNKKQPVHTTPLGKGLFKVAFPFSQWFRIYGRLFRIDIEKDYKTDLASIPKLLQWIYPPDGLYRAAVIIHDLLFQICGKRGENRAIQIWEFMDGAWLKVYIKFTKKECNIIMRNIMIDWGVGKVTRNTFYSAVQAWPFAF